MAIRRRPNRATMGVKTWDLFRSQTSKRTGTRYAMKRVAAPKGLGKSRRSKWRKAAGYVIEPVGRITASKRRNPRRRSNPRRQTPKQRAASIRNLAKARARRRGRSGGFHKGKGSRRPASKRFAAYASKPGWWRSTSASEVPAGWHYNPKRRSRKRRRTITRRRRRLNPRRRLRANPRRRTRRVRTLRRQIRRAVGRRARSVKVLRRRVRRLNPRRRYRRIVRRRRNPGLQPKAILKMIGVGLGGFLGGGLVQDLLKRALKNFKDETTGAPKIPAAVVQYGAPAALGLVVHFWAAKKFKMAKTTRNALYVGLALSAFREYLVKKLCALAPSIGKYFGQAAYLGAEAGTTPLDFKNLSGDQLKAAAEASLAAPGTSGMGRFISYGGQSAYAAPAGFGRYISNGQAGLGRYLNEPEGYRPSDSMPGGMGEFYAAPAGLGEFYAAPAGVGDALMEQIDRMAGLSQGELANEGVRAFPGPGEKALKVSPQVAQHLSGLGMARVVGTSITNPGSVVAMVRAGGRAVTGQIGPSSVDDTIGQAPALGAKSPFRSLYGVA